MNDTQPFCYESVDARPVKSFFVSMLTRDIRLEEAILDLLDNCVDGILRSQGGKGAKPYEGYKAEIEFNSNFFSISDNCGGIPWTLKDYAFRMGRSPEREPDETGSVGVYGIGMKRAVFKIGGDCLISTRNATHHYEVEINRDWMTNEDVWDLPVRNASKSMNYDGTTIEVRKIHPGISETFGEGAKAFKTALDEMVSSHYAYIIDKGFEVTINGDAVKPHTIDIVYVDGDKEIDNAIRPFIFKTTSDDVDVFLAVGFTRPIPPVSEILNEQEAVQYSSDDAGWTILCNDRAVVHCDRSELTGWGEENVPRYHTQFIAISGIVDFRCKDPGKLPTTTTKRGIDASSPLFLQIKNKMREGMKVFTDYTNKWKGLADESKNHIQGGRQLSLEELKLESERLRFTSTRRVPLGFQFTPKLPVPPRIQKTVRRIAFDRELEEIKAVADYIGESNMRPSEVGEYCFDTFYEEVSR